MSNRHEIELEAASIVGAAEAELADTLDDEGFRSRLEVVVDAYASTALDAEQRSVAAESLTEIVVVHMRLAGDRRRHPAIAREAVTKPIIVAGFPRAGTTFLHALLSVDPANHAPEWWEVMHPSPPPGAATRDDHRRQVAQREVADFVRRCPGVRVAHPYFVEGAETIMECESLFTFDLRNTYPFALFRIPQVPALDLFGDPVQAYAFHRRFLQNLQWGRRPRRWAVKGTDHQFMLPVVLATYPDACVIWPHRDPVTVVASLVELMGALIEGITGTPVDRAAVAPGVVDAIATRLDRALSDPSIDADNVVHLDYDRFTAEPARQLRAVYERFGMEFTGDYERRIDGWLTDPRHRSDRYGTFAYSLERDGLDASEVRSRFAAYIERFDVPAHA